MKIGFYDSLRRLSEDSKCPIVLTCNALPEPRGPETFPLQKGIKDIPFLESGDLRRAGGKLRQQLFLVLRVKRGQHRFGRDQIS